MEVLCKCCGGGHIFDVTVKTTDAVKARPVNNNQDECTLPFFFGVYYCSDCGAVVGQTDGDSNKKRNAVNHVEEKIKKKSYSGNKKPATQKQKDYVRGLIDEKYLGGVYASLDYDNMTGQEAHKLIQKLINMK